MQAIHPIRYDAADMPLCRYCRGDVPTGHRNYFVCLDHCPEPFRPRMLAAIANEFNADDARLCVAMGIAPLHEFPPSPVRLEIAMQGEAVRKIREAHSMRNRKPLMSDERRGQGAGELDLGEIL
jgi:hypothetical protein